MRACAWRPSVRRGMLRLRRPRQTTSVLTQDTRSEKLSSGVHLVRRVPE